MLQVKNFEKFQHYRDRAPIWIKLYAYLLSDYEFGRLEDTAKAHLMLIWVLASQTGNKLPNDPGWIQTRIGARDPVDVGNLIATGWLIDTDSKSASKSASNGVTDDASRFARERREEERRGEESSSSGEIAAAVLHFTNEFHQSQFDWIEVRQYVENTKRHLKNPAGLARRLYRTGEEDIEIAAFLAKIELETGREQGSEIAMDFSFDDYVEELVANHRLSELENEREGIEERGGPKLEWERKVIAYFQNQPSAKENL